MGKISKISKLDENWEKLFDKHKIAQEIQQNGYFEISSKQINEFREARLMTKFDHRANLPKLFKDNDLSILPTTRGDYIIGNFDVYSDVKYKEIKPKKIALPSHIKSIETNDIYSEAVALNCAFSSGVIADVLGEDVLPTVSGRMSTGIFDFNVDTNLGKKVKIEVKNAQCEIDGGYESRNKLAILEAKNTTSSDFLVRQLYYPYRLWQNKVNKEVVPVFMTYSNNVYSFFVYKFQNNIEYNSLKLVEQKDYTIGTEIITEKDIRCILATVKVEKYEPLIAFPQCNDFNKIIDLLSLLYQNDLNKGYITRNYDFDERQTNYYTDGARYLGLVEKTSDENTGEITFKLTEKGRKLLEAPYKERVLGIVRCILEHKIFNRCIRKYLEDQEIDKNDIVGLMKQSNLYNIRSEATFERRASTISSWCKWIIGLIER